MLTVGVVHFFLTEKNALCCVKHHLLSVAGRGNGEVAE